MKKGRIKNIIINILIGKRYWELTNIDDQVRYATINFIFMAGMIPLAIIGITAINADIVRAILDFVMALMCLSCIILVRTKIKLIYITIPPVTIFGSYCLYLLYTGTLNLWVSVWFIAFPMIAFFLCRMTAGIIESLSGLIVAVLIMFVPIMQNPPPIDIRVRYIAVYLFILALTFIYERINVLKNRKEALLNAELAQERDIIETMKDNIHQGIFLMNKDLKILPQYSRPLISILSYYDSELAGKNFLDILNASLDAKQLQTMKTYFSMVFEKSKSTKVLESANPISEFEYIIDDRMKTLSTRFHLIEQSGAEEMVIGIIQDITREKEFEKEFQAQKEAQELEMKNMFDVIQIDSLVFKDFIEDTEDNFNDINLLLKDKSLTERQVVTKFFQNVHAIKSNALILGLETFGKKLHTLEDAIKKVSDQKVITVDDVLHLAVELEMIMRDKDSYLKMINRIESFKTSNQLDSFFIHSLNKAVEKISVETKKKVELRAGEMDLEILESGLRKPIKDILFQCVRNSIYHGIETPDVRVKKNKKPQGILTVSVKKIDGKAEVIFSDDGCGLDWEKIKAKYYQLNPDSMDASRKDLITSIFMPQFSTSEETTSVAGRGIGLSLVKDLVKKNDGTINVNSSEAGLTFKFIFPITG